MMLFCYATTKLSFVGPSHRQQEAGGGDGREEVGIGRVGLLSLLRRRIPWRFRAKTVWPLVECRVPPSCTRSFAVTGQAG